MFQVNQSDEKLYQKSNPPPGNVLITNEIVKTKDREGHTIINNKYKILNKLGQGSQAKVKLTQLINQQCDENYVPQYFALKVFFKPYLMKQRSFTRSTSSSSGSSRKRLSYTTALDEVYQEIEIMKRIDHPNIIKLFEILDDPQSDKLYLVMPAADCGECLEWDEEKMCFTPNKKVQFRMSSKFNKLTPEKAQFYSEDFLKKVAKNLIQSIDYLHSDLNIVHRDIKPANILMDEAGNPLLVDFGKARILTSDEDDSTTSIQGTYMFLPPECCSFDTEIYSMKRADIWALGITLYCLTFNNFPFQLANTEIQLMENICQTKPSFEGREISEELRDLLQTMLEKDPSKRASLEDLKRHRFLHEDYVSINQTKQIIKRMKALEKQKGYEIRLQCMEDLQPCQEGESPRIITIQNS